MFKTKLRHSIYALATFVAVVLMTGCASDSPDGPDNPEETRFPAKIRMASADPHALGNELIKNYFVVFITKEDQKVKKIFYRDLTKHSSPVNEEQIDGVIPIGNYDVVAFANLSPDTLEMVASGLKFEEGEKAPTSFYNLIYETWDLNKLDLNNWPNGRDVPMAGYKQNVSVKFEKDQSFDIEVVRLVGKVEFEFSSEATEDIKVNYVTVFPHPGKQPLDIFPVYEQLGDNIGTDIWNDDDYPVLSQQFNFSKEINLPTGNPNNEVSDYFYLRECSATYGINETERLRISINITRTSQALGTHSEEQYYVTDKLQWINRNDYIQIPIRFTDFDVTLTPRFYPPIGGYPAMTLRQDGTQQYITFGTEGLFEIEPTAKKAFNGEVVGKERIRMEIDSVKGDTGIFSRVPTMNETTGELIGGVSNSTGMGIVYVSVYVNTGTVGVWRKYPRIVYILRKNS